MAGRTDLETNDRIRLQLPTDAAYGRLARIAATTLARRLGFGFRAIEDLGLALDETLILLLSDPRTGADGSLEVVLEVEGEGLAIQVTAADVADDPSDARPDDDDVQRFRLLAGDLVAEWAVDVERASVRLVAHH